MVVIDVQDFENCRVQTDRTHCDLIEGHEVFCIYQLVDYCGCIYVLGPAENFTINRCILGLAVVFEYGGKGRLAKLRSRFKFMN